MSNTIQTNMGLMGSAKLESLCWNLTLMPKMRSSCCYYYQILNYIANNKMGHIINGLTNTKTCFQDLTPLMQARERESPSQNLAIPGPIND